VIGGGLLVHNVSGPRRKAATKREAHIISVGVNHMNVDLRLLKNLISKRGDEIEMSVAGTGYLAKTVIGVGTFLLDNEGDFELLTAKQKVVFEKFLKPLLDQPRR